MTSRAGAARVTITRDGETLWRLVVVRPAASSGAAGSGVELRGVTYRGTRVLRRAHVPILNVRYDGNACGPYRDWQNEEGRFQAQGSTVAPGFRLCPQPATTVLDTGSDIGNFAGVAVYVDGEEVVLVSELEAGWYRYVSSWRLHADGTIRPRFGFGAVENSCVCNHPSSPRLLAAGLRHRRGGRRRGRRTQRSPAGRTRLDLAPAHARDPSRTQRQPQATLAGPQPDHRAGLRRGARGRGRYSRLLRGRRLLGAALPQRPTRRQRGDHRHQGPHRQLHQRRVDRRTNVVVWYAAHFTHDTTHEHAGDGNHIVGPTLRPDRW